MNLYRNESCTPKWDAQRNLEGRTHYVDDDTLRFHRARVLNTFSPYGGLLFVLIESYAVDPDGCQRAFRPVIFDVFGNVIERPKLDEGFKTSKQAINSMWDSIDSIDPLEVTENAIANYTMQCDREIQYLREDIAKLRERNIA